jgi:predicted O-methyltransferase YrrM
LRSSYKENNYGDIFRALILTQKPRLVVECGVLDGYSTMNIANALRFNVLERGISSKFFAFDLWDEYQYKHGDIENVVNMLISHGLGSYVLLGNGDAFEVSNNVLDGAVDFLHMDISNDGDILLKTLDCWGDKISPNGVIAFEGGSEERDNGWIRKYNKRPIRPVLFDLKGWNFQIFDPYPSLTLLWRKIK